MTKVTIDPCNVCGSTDMSLVDGYYYCVECGTQDENVRQTIIEEKALADGTFAIKRKKKLTTAVEEKHELCGEWHKWHAYNFILVGLVDELITAGAKETFKMKALWLWTEYIKNFQNKEELGLSNENQSNIINTEDIEDSNAHTEKKTKKQNQMKMTKDVGFLKKATLLSLLYVALNLDGSDIQMSDLMRFIREGRLDINNCKKYVPKEINLDLIPGWKSFDRSFCVYIRDAIVTSISLLNCLNIPPRLPDLRKIVDKFMKELCLPYDFKNLVLSLMHLVPCNYLEIDVREMKSLVRFPAYECVVMSYVLVAFKMCFGLDDNYEISLSDVIDRINCDKSYLKSYKLGSCTMPTDRLFSFREWCNFIKLRKILLSKYYLHMAEQHLYEIDDYVYMEQTQNEISKQPKKYTDEIIMKLLDKLVVINKVEVIPKSEFKPTTTPLSTYTEIITEYIKDPDMRLLFSEDFTQYSLKYAVENLQLLDINDDKNILFGVNESNKLINSDIYGILQTTKLNVELVYVRNCDNKNWLLTNQPKAEHFEKISEYCENDKNSSCGYDFPAETISSNNKDSDCNEILDIVKDKIIAEKEMELIVEENIDINIFDDNFDDIKEEIESNENELSDIDESKIKEEGVFDIHETNTFTCNDTLDENFPGEDLHSQPSNDESNSDLFFNPNTFDRERVIRELILACCKKYKIQIPKEYDTKEPNKRKPVTLKHTSDENCPKRRRMSNSNKKPKTSSVRDEVNELIAAYYQNVEHDILQQLSEHVKAAISNNEILQTQNITNNLEDDCLTGSNVISTDHANVDETFENCIISNGTLDQIHDIDFVDENENSHDPKSREKEYDINQLYVKVNDESDSDDPFDITDDPVISEILDRKIKEIEKCKEPLKFTQAERKRTEDFDDHIPLSVIREEKLMLNKQKNCFESIKLQPLVEDSSKIKNFKYWVRNYASAKVTKTHNLNEVFYKELEQNFPKSFYFVIRECANMLEITPYQLYKAMVNLESRLLSC